MGTRMESLNPNSLRDWVQEHTLKPGESASMSNYLVDGNIILYSIGCLPDDSSSEIRRSVNGAPPNVEATLKKGDKPIVLTINGGKGKLRVVRRFSHV